MDLPVIPGEARNASSISRPESREIPHFVDSVRNDDLWTTLGFPSSMTLAVAQARIERSKTAFGAATGEVP